MKIGIVAGVIVLIIALVVCLVPLKQVAYTVTVDYQDTETIMKQSHWSTENWIHLLLKL